MRKKKRNKGDAAKLEMTPMIDVVFQLLIFFIVTLKQEDILSHLDVSRPASDSAPPPEVKADDMVTVMVYRDGYIMNGRRISRGTLDRKLTKMSSYNKDVSVVIKCMPDSPHSKLINLLDICAKTGLENLSVFSM